MGIKKGTGFQFYYIATPLADVTPGTVKAASWNINNNIQSTEVNSSREDNTVTTRLNGGTEVSLGGKRTDEISFQIADDPDDAMHAALTTAYNADNEIAFADCDGPIGTDDTRADVGNFNIKTMRKTRGESGAALVAVTAKPTAIFALGVVIAT